MAGSGTTGQTITGDDFVGGLGVDTHIPYTDGLYSNISLVESELSYLGVTQVRDGITDGQNGSAPLSSYIALAQAGVHFTFVVEGSSNSDLLSTLSLIDQVEEAVPGSITAIEGPNEINNNPVSYNGVSGLQGALDLQTALVADVKADPVLAGVPIDYFTGYNTTTTAAGPDPVASGLANYDNQHPYPVDGLPPAEFVARSVALGNTTNPNEPAVYTETGYSSSALDPTVQAKYTLDLIMDAEQQGISKTYLYQLMDAYAPGTYQGNDGSGLFDYTETAKPAATAIHNLTTLLADTGAGAATFQSTPLNYAVSGLPASGNSLAIEESNGSYFVVVWAEPEIWNSATNTEIAAPSENVTVSLPNSYSSLQVFDPLAGTSPIATYSNQSSVTVAVTDHPILIELSATLTTTTGVAEDGPIAGATVFADANGTGVLASTDAQTTTNADGDFTLSGGTGPLVLQGGTDVDTNLPFQGVLTAPSGSTVITPLTTLLNDLLPGNPTSSQISSAEGAILTAFNVTLPSGESLTTLDVNAGALAGDPVSEALVTAGGEVIDTAEILGAGLAKIAGVSFTTAYTAVVMSLADQIANTPGAALDLTAATTLQSILQSAATSVGLGTPIASNLATDLISLTAASNQAIVASVASLTGGAAVKALSAVEYVAQGETTSALQSGTNFDIVAADYTNGNLAQAIQAADGSVACYLKGVLILTPLGEIPVEDLSIGDRVFTGSGGAKPIKWIGRRSYLGRQAQCDPEIIPVRIRAGAIADRCPKRDLYISPRHAVFIDGQLIPAAALINGASIDRATGLEEVHYFHIELEDHDLVLAEGALCETFVDDTSRGVFHNIAEYYALYPEANAPRAAVYFAPRMGEGQELEAIRARLAGRAACIDADGRAQAVSLRGVLDLANRTQIEGWGYDRLDPERTLDVVVLCNGAVIAKVSADIYREDLETAGIGDGRHAFKLRLEAPLSHSQRHAVEVRFADDWSLLEEGPMIIEADPTPSRGALGELGGNLDALTHSRISGWAQDAAQPSHPVALIISVGERVLGRVVANRFRSDLLDARIGDGRHAFDLVIPQGLRRDQDQVIRIQREADGRDLPGTPQILAAPLFDAADREAILAQAFSGGERLEDDERAVALLARHTEALLARRAERTGGKVEREALAAHRRRWGGDPALPLTTEDWTEPKLRVLVIDDQVVDPAEDAGSVALVSHMRALKALDYDVVFAAAGAFEDRGRLDRLAAHEEIAVCGKPHYTCVEDVMSRHRGDFDLIYLHRLTNAQRYQALAKAYCPKAWVVFSVADLQHVRLAGQAKIEARPELLALSRAMERAELDAAAQADLTITHSASEAALLHRQRPNAKVAVIPFAPSVRSPPPPFGQRSGLAFIGSFGHAPNPDAVWWLASTILPMVWTEDPNVTCLIVGHGWTQEALPEVDSRLKILGPVDDLSDVFDKVRLTVAPLQFGAGIKGKVLESFASGVPCVMSEVAADGLPLSLPLRVLIGSRAEDMAELILGCHSNERANEKLSLEGRAWVQQRFSQDEVTRALGEALGHAPADALREAG